MYLSIVLTAPAPGTVLVRGDMTFEILHNIIVLSEGHGFLSTSSTECSTLGSGDIFVSIPATAPTGRYVLPLSLSRRFNVAAGTSTFYMNFSQSSGGGINVLAGGMDLAFNPD